MPYAALAAVQRFSVRDLVKRNTWWSGFGPGSKFTGLNLWRCAVDLRILPKSLPTLHLCVFTYSCSLRKASKSNLSPILEVLSGNPKTRLQTLVLFARKTEAPMRCMKAMIEFNKLEDLSTECAELFPSGFFWRRVRFVCLSTSDVPISRQAGRQPNPVREAD